MARHALYFPTIRVPHSDWFMRMLLYWDSVGTIVPQQMTERLGATLGVRLANYHEYGLVRMVTPDRYLSVRHEFAEEFMATAALIDAADERREAFAHALADYEQRGEEGLRAHADSIMRIHSGKADFDLLNELSGHGLAAHDSGSPSRSWWLVEAHLARVYMAALSRLLASVEEDGKPLMDPVTDGAVDLQALAQADEAFSQRLGEVRSALLEVTLPSITGPASAVDLRDFKRRHGPRLVEFRQEIESRAMAIAEKDGAAAEAALRNAMDGLQGEVDAIERALEETPFRRNPKGALLRVAAVVATGAVKTALDTTAVIDEAPNVKQAIEKAFGPASDGSAAGHAAYAALARRELRRFTAQAD